MRVWQWRGDRTAALRHAIFQATYSRDWPAEFRYRFASTSRWKAVEIRTRLRFDAHFSIENLRRARPDSILMDGGALVSTHRWKRRRHVEDGSLASLKSGPKQINADHEDLALAA